MRPGWPHRMVLVPGVLALLPEYASLQDPVGDLRAACLEAVSWLGRDVEVISGSDSGERVGASLLASTTRTDHAGSFLLIGNGSTMLSEKAPGFFDPRAAAADQHLRDWLLTGGLLDTDVCNEVGADLYALIDSCGLEGTPTLVSVDYDDAPFGVQYWVVRWLLVSPWDST